MTAILADDNSKYFFNENDKIPIRMPPQFNDAYLCH